MSNTCKICGGDFFDKTLLCYENMPKAAQFLPTKETLISDEGISLKLLQCSLCGTVQLNNDPVPYYKDVIRSTSFSPAMIEFRKKQFFSLIQTHSLRGKKILEIGCGTGEYLPLLQELGVNAFGIEHSAETLKNALLQKKNIIPGFIETASTKITNAPFDAFLFFNFLEHLPNPNDVLRGIHYNLSELAVGIIEVPNFDMILKEKLFSEFISDHLFYFTKTTLMHLLEKNGFHVLECTEAWDSYILSATVKKRSPLPLSSFQEEQEKITQKLHGFTKPFKKIAVWGAGHQAFTMISLSNITKKINYIVDSAPFKQNKFTPATHIPIHAPEKLLTDKVDAIIVMAAGYSNEVVKIILEKYDTGMSIAMLHHNDLKVLRHSGSDTFTKI